MSSSVSGGLNVTGKYSGKSLAIPVSLKAQAPSVASRQPVTFGVPLPKGQLQTCVAGWLQNESHRIEAQGRVLARWSDQSVKWLLVDFMAPPLAANQSQWTLRVSDGKDVKAKPSSTKTAINSTNAGLTVETGSTVATFSRHRDATLCQIRYIDDRGWNSIAAVLTDSKGITRAAHIGRIEVDEQGPVRTTIAIDGDFPHSRGLQFAARVCLFKGTGLTRVQFTLRNPNRAIHRGGMWDLGDPGSFFFEDLSIVLKPAEKPENVRWQTAPGQPIHETGEPSVEIYQDSSGGENWQSRNHVNHEGRVPCRFQGYRATSAEQVESGNRANPVLSIASRNASTTIAVPEFWQQFPKSLACHDGEIRIGLFPKQWDDQFELQGGEQKTHTVWFHFGEGDAVANQLLQWVHQPLEVSVAPEWIASSQAVRSFLPECDDSDLRLQRYMAEVLAGPRSIDAGRERIDEYGWRNYGDLHADHEEAYYNGPKPVISHYNNQFDVVYGLILHFLRSADGRYFELLRSLARHVIDIDIYHTTQDRQAYSGGLFWFTDHYLDAATSTHRTYSTSNKPANGAPYGGGPGCEHNFTTGLLHYYYLTGDRQALTAALQLAEWVLQMDDGRGNLLGLVDCGATGLASGSASSCRHYPGRGAANSVNALVDAWVASGQRRFLEKAESLIRRVIHPDDQVADRDLLNAEKNWSYTMFLSSLAKYLAAKCEADELDGMYSYSQACLLSYAEWMLEHERPYFDRPNELEYPTEAWAAQEFRKANVFRLAADHAGGELKTRLLERGTQFAERAWKDLLRFDSRFTARAVAVVMTEGVTDQFYRAQVPETFPQAREHHAGDRREDFVPQRLRVRAQATKPPGLFHLGIGLLDVRRWANVSFRF